MRIVEVLNILSKYGISENYPIWAEHDVIGFIIDPDLISETDLRRLNELGVFYNHDYKSLTMYT